MRSIDKIIIHCSATTKAQNIGVQEIKTWHIKQGFTDIGYHFVIRRNGEIEEGRGLENIGAHCKGQNAHSIGICLVGGVDSAKKPENNFTTEQFKALRFLVAHLLAKFPKSSVHGHNEFSNKACPCFSVADFFAKA